MKRSERSIKNLISELQSGSELTDESRLFLVDLLRNGGNNIPRDDQFIRQSWQLNERIKELKCLYSMMDLLFRNRNNFDSALQEAVNLIPHGYVFPAETHARLEIGDQSYTSDHFRETDWSMSSELELPGKVTGLLSVNVEYKDGEDWSTPFLDEEAELLEMLAKLIGSFYSQYHISGLLTEKEEYLYMFRLGIEYSEEAIFITDAEGRIIFVNAAFSRIYGYKESEVLGENPRILKSGLNSDEFYKKMWDKLLDGQIASGEIVNRRKDGELITLEYSSNPIVNREGKLIGFLAIQHDITERKRMEVQLREYEQKLRDIVESSTNLFYSHNPEGVITYISPQVEEFFGFTFEGEEFKWTDFITDHPVNKAAFDYTEKALATGKIQPPYEMELKRADGDTIWVEVREAPVVRDGKVVSMTGSLTDISERKLSQLKLEESLNEKDTLLAEIHHRVKNNLAVVSGMLLLQAQEDEKNDIEIAERLFESVVRIKTMANIHEQLYKSTSFSKIEISENFRELIRDIIDTFRSDADLQTEFDCDTILLNINQAIPFSLIVNEVVTNILKHAFRNRDSGCIIIKLREKNGRIMLAITDDGVGLPDDFNPENVETLGLHLIKLLTQQIKADYKYSSDSSGTTFDVSFEKMNIKGSGSTLLK